MLSVNVNQLVSSWDGVEFSGCINFLLLHNNVITI